MYPVSSEFAQQVMISHQALIRVYVLIVGSNPVEIPISGGSVEIDDSRDIRTTCTINVADPTLVPLKKGDLLHPDTGNELEVWRGVMTSHGAEYVPLGVFVMTKPTISQDNNSFGFQITGSDRALLVQRARWTAPYPIADGTNVIDAVRAALHDRVPGLQDLLVNDPTNAQTPAVTFGLDTNNDPWSDIQGLLSAHGYELFLNALGRPVARPIPAITGNPGAVASATYISGKSPLLSVERDIDPSQRYTAVVVRGEGTGVATPVQSIAQTPGVPFMPYFYTSNLITTQEQADSVAAAMLQQVGSSYEDVQITIVPNPALQAGDVIGVAHSPVGIDNWYIASQLTIPLSPTDSMSITMKPQR